MEGVEKGEKREVYYAISVLTNIEMSALLGCKENMNIILGLIVNNKAFLKKQKEVDDISNLLIDEY